MRDIVITLANSGDPAQPVFIRNMKVDQVGRALKVDTLLVLTCQRKSREYLESLYQSVQVRNRLDRTQIRPVTAVHTKPDIFIVMC